MSGLTVDDDTLRVSGLAPSGAGRVLVIACGALAREIIALQKLNGRQYLDLQCLPAILHNHPDKITDAVRTTVTARAAQYDRIFVAYADCGTGGTLAQYCAEAGIDMIAGPHCYSFFEGNDSFAARDEISAFYLTDFLTRQFDAFVVKPLGLDRHPELLPMYFGNYDKLVYLAQTRDPALEQSAKACADYLGLRYEYRFTGYGGLAEALAQV